MAFENDATSRANFNLTDMRSRISIQRSHAHALV